MPNIMNFDLIIFDCDGVLIDSEILSNRAEVELLKSFGIEFELGDYMAQFVGKSTKDVLKPTFRTSVFTTINP